MSPKTLSRRAAVFMLVLLAAALTLAACGSTNLESQIADKKWVAADPTCQGPVIMPPNFLLESKTKFVKIAWPPPTPTPVPTKPRPIWDIEMKFVNLDYHYEMKPEAPERLTFIAVAYGNPRTDYRVKLENGLLLLSPQSGTPTCKYKQN